MTAAPELKRVVVSELWPCQIVQTHCALCRRDLATILDDRPLGEVPFGEGIHRRMAELWACAPTCATAVSRRPGR